MENKKIRNASEKRGEASGEKKIIIKAADDSAQRIAETAVGIVTDGTGESIAESARKPPKRPQPKTTPGCSPSAMQTAESPRQAHEKGADGSRRPINGRKAGFSKKMILYTIPIVLTGILQLLFNAADLIMVGNFCGSLSVAAVGATGALINLLVNLFIGLSVGAGVAVAHALGAKKSKTVFETVAYAIPGHLGGAVLTVVGLLFSSNFLEKDGDLPADEKKIVILIINILE